MPECNPRPPEVQSINLRPLTVADVLFLNSPLRPLPGEIDEDGFTLKGSRRPADDPRWQPLKAKAPAPAVAAYDPRAAFEWAYQDESGAPLFHSVRTLEKQFWQSPADGNGGWVKPTKGCMDGVRLVPLYLPEVLAAIRNSGLILIAEGERKVDLLRHLGYDATCKYLAQAGRNFGSITHGSFFRVVLRTQNHRLAGQ